MSASSHDLPKLCPSCGQPREDCERWEDAALGWVCENTGRDIPGWPVFAGQFLHGPAFCPLSCGGCDGRHHWREAGMLDPDGPPEDDPAERAVAEYDRRHGTAHRVAHLTCRHCPAWAELELLDVLDPEGDGVTDGELDPDAY